MIIYNYRTPVEITGGENVGITGENLIHTQEFVIRGLADGDMTFAIHLRFTDGSVNSVVPDIVESKTDGTHIVWCVRKNDIFAHGFFEVQLEGRGSDEAVFQTEIVMLYADESIPIEDKTYENPNSETLKLRDEAYAMFEKIDGQEKQIAETAELIKHSDITKKADKADTLLGYGITNAYTKTETDEKVNQKQDKLNFDSTPTIGSQSIMTSDRIAAALSYKADSKDVSKKANKTDVDTLLLDKEDKFYKVTDKRSLTDEAVNYPSVKYLTDYYYSSDETDIMLAEKYDASEVECGNCVLTPYTSSVSKVKSANAYYEKIGNRVFVNVKIETNAFGASSNVILTNLPYKCVDETVQYFSCLGSSNIVRTGFVYAKSTWIGFKASDSTAFSDGEIINCVFSYRIS